MLIDGRFDSSFLIVARLVKIRLKSPRHVDPRVLEAPKEQLLNFRVIHADSELATEFPCHLHDLGGITHLAMPASCLGGPRERTRVCPTCPRRDDESHQPVGRVAASR